MFRRNRPKTFTIFSFDSHVSLTIRDRDACSAFKGAVVTGHRRTDAPTRCVHGHELKRHARHVYDFLRIYRRRTTAGPTCPVGTTATRLHPRPPSNIKPSVYRASCACAVECFGVGCEARAYRAAYFLGVRLFFRTESWVFGEFILKRHLIIRIM